MQEAVAALRIAPEWVIAARPNECDGRIAAGLADPIPYGAGKVDALDRAVGSRSIVAAFGDNAFDLEMMKRARIAVAVRPKARLLERAHELSSMIELQAPD